MKIDWKTLSFAMITSIIPTLVSVIILSIKTFHTYSNIPCENISEYPPGKVSITIAEATTSPYLQLLNILGFSLVSLHN